ncbi:hypothetical protein ACSBR2_039691 [Camellia fascicularis]
MSSEYYSLCIPGSGFSTSLPSLELILCIFLIAAVFGFCLARPHLGSLKSASRGSIKVRHSWTLWSTHYQTRLRFHWLFDSQSPRKSR